MLHSESMDIFLANSKSILENLAAFRSIKIMDGTLIGG